MEGVGEGKDSPGSELLIRAVDRDDPRPLWVTVWGGPNVLAQALWKVRATRSPEELARFVAKLRVYAISDQDDSGPWIRKEFPDLFYIVTPGINAGGGFHHATWIAIGGDKFHGRFGGADFSLVTNEWLDRNVRRKGPVGRRVSPLGIHDGRRHAVVPQPDQQRPERSRASELGRLGRPLRTLHAAHGEVVPGTRDPSRSGPTPETKSWGTTANGTPPTTPPSGAGASAYQNDFAARMDWTIKPYAEANHPPVPKLDHPASSQPSPANAWNSARQARPIPTAIRSPSSGSATRRPARAGCRTPARA